MLLYIIYYGLNSYILLSTISLTLLYNCPSFYNQHLLTNAYSTREGGEGGGDVGGDSGGDGGGD